MITTRTLSNGVRMVMEEMPAVHSVAIGIWVKTGAVDEEKKYAGISHFVEHMMFKGTENRTARQIAGDVDRIGGAMNAFTGKEATCYYVKTVSDHYREAADVLVDMMEHSLFAKEEMDRERKVIGEEIKMGEDSPEDVAHDKLIEALFRREPLGNSVIGTRTSLNRITHNVMAEYVRTHYVRDNMVISVAGNFDPEEVCDYFQGTMLSLGKTGPARERSVGSPAPEYHSVKRDIKQSHICLGTRGVNLADPRSYAMSVLSQLLGGSMSSRLFQNIRERKGLAYSVYSTTGSFRDAGYFEIYAGVANDQVKAAVEGIREELDILASKPVEEEAVRSAVEQMKSSYAFSQESTSARMIVNGKNYLLLDRVFNEEEVLEGYNNVTAASLEEVKKLICDFSRYSVSVASGVKVNRKSVMEE